jgi:NAD(P)-dependent dehydrogenase (short-subunit alcohol dehydrogenase family)
VDPNGRDPAVMELATRFGDADEPVRGVLDSLEERLAWGADEDPPVVEGLEVDGETLLSMIGMELYYEESSGYLGNTLAALASGDQESTEYYLGYLYGETYGLYEEEEAEEVRSFVGKLPEEFQEIDVLVNNA